MAAKSENSAGIIDSETAAKLLMLTAHRVRQLVSAGWIKKVGRDRYRVVDVVQGYVGFLKDEARRSSQSAAASAVQEARAEEIRLRTADKRREQEAKGQAAALEAIDTVAGPLKPDVLAILPRLVKDLALRRQLEDAIDDAFAAMSKRAATVAGKLERQGHAQPKVRKARSRK
ncbi:MAG: hypothetical protein R3D69_10645 [Xanthobacteraceae bacterium]